MEFAAKILLNSKTYRKEGKEILLVGVNCSNLSLITTNDYEKAPIFTIKEADLTIKNPMFITALNNMNFEQNRGRDNWLKPCLFTKGRYEENPELRLLMQSLLGHSYYMPSSFRLADRISFELK